MDPSRLWGGLMWPLGFVRLVPHGGPGTWHCCEHHGHMQSLLNGWVGVKGSSLEIGYLYETLKVCEGSWPPAKISHSSTSLMPFFSLTPHEPCADPARVLNMPPVIYVPVGIHGYIRCPVDAEPPATVVKWNKDGRPLQVEKVLEGCMWGHSEIHSCH